ncbi:hypothetical protein B0H67DRAFT_108033 [Lasiosphaeris hirsuta]|uniref:Uncharacterized protein n=1 Tax=Lasiosphaeris hirsuta TaxID=260670 RepID=A0AA40E6R6_9PEZI|nr:hypothetical protein B0H67DRAFT_108033 [Lasiosphaeris hirsuta]
MHIMFVGCMAQLLSPARGWDFIVAVALRERDGRVEIDVAKNDCFSGTCRQLIPTFFRALESHLSRGTQHDLAENEDISVASSDEFEATAIAYAGQRTNNSVDLLRNLVQSVSKKHSWNLQRQPTFRETFERWNSFHGLLHQRNMAAASFREKIVRQAYLCVAPADVRALLHAMFLPKSASEVWEGLRCLARPIADCRLLQQSSRASEISAYAKSFPSDSNLVGRGWNLRIGLTSQRLGVASVPTASR